MRPPPGESKSLSIMHLATNLVPLIKTVLQQHREVTRALLETHLKAYRQPNRT
jgi:hypothetical protein